MGGGSVRASSGNHSGDNQSRREKRTLPHLGQRITAPDEPSSVRSNPNGPDLPLLTGARKARANYLGSHDDRIAIEATQAHWPGRARMKILVVDDHPLVCDALAKLLPQLNPSTEVRAAMNAGAATAILDSEPDVALVLLDLALPGTRGLDFLADLMLDYPGVPIVVLSATHDEATVAAALAAGARGFIAKTASPHALLAALERVFDGETYRTDDLTPEPESDGVRIASSELGLTARQSDVLRLLVQGKPNKLICFSL